MDSTLDYLRDRFGVKTLKDLRGVDTDDAFWYTVEDA